MEFQRLIIKARSGNFMGVLNYLSLIVKHYSSVRVASCPCTRAINRFLRLRHELTCALANQKAASHLRQSGYMSGHHAQAAKGEFKRHATVRHA